MIGAGRRRHQLRFQRQGEQVDEYGNVDDDWADLFSCFGNVRETTGKERVAAGALENVRTATVRVQANTQTRGLTEADRVVARNETWGILGIANADDKGAMLDLLVEAVGGDI